MEKKDNSPVEFDNQKKSSEETKSDSMEETAIMSEDDFDNIKTQIIESPFAKPARLIVVFGPDQGREFPLTKPEMTIGRALTCDIILNDPTVSRNHCQVIKDGLQFKLKDLGSGNGTKLNDVRITDVSPLSEGARIELGQTVMAFTTKLSGMPDVPDKRPEVGHDDRTLATEIPKELGIHSEKRSVEQDSTGGKKGMLFVILGLIVLVVVGGVGLYWGLGVGRSGNKAVHKVTKQESTHTKALKLYNQGLVSMGRKDWDQAIEEFQEALELDPELTRASRRLEISQKERETEKTIKKAGVLAGKGKVDEAKQLLNAVPKDSVYYTEARSKLLLLTDKQAALAIEKVKALVAAGNAKEGKELFLQLLDKYPTNTEVMALAKLFENKKKPVRKHKRRWSTPDFPSAATRRAGRRRAKRFDMKEVISLYESGDFDAAVKKLRDYVSTTSRASEKREKTQLADAIQSFASLYRAGKSASEAGDYTTTIRNLKRAKPLDVSISGKYQGDIKGLLAAAYQKRAAQFVMKKQYVQAARDARAALALNPSDRAALLVLNKCQQVAKNFYDSAMADMNDGNMASARLKLQKVMQLVTRDSDLYKQASTRYQQLR